MPIKPDWIEDKVSPEFVDTVIKYIDSGELEKVSYDYYLSIVKNQIGSEGEEAKEKLEELTETYEGRGGHGRLTIPTLRYRHWNFHKERNESF